MKLAVFAVVLVGLAVQPQPNSTLIDPVGKWTFNAQTDTGQAMTGTLDITGSLGAYTGQATTADGNSVPVTDVLTSPKSIIMILQLPTSFVVVKITRDAAGKFAGQWGEIQQAMAVTMTKVPK